jgi:hypothetical protein
MRIREIKIADIVLGTNWILSETTDATSEMVDWEVEECASFRPTDTVVYSALAVLESGKARPLLLIREVGTPEWWGDTCEYVDGTWRDLAHSDELSLEEFVASPLDNDPSFMGHYAHERQRAGFARFRDHLE